jgi:hypothetical protein
MRCSLPGALALCLLLTACGPSDPPEAVPINGSGGSGGGGATTGGTVAGVAIRSHNAGTDCMSCHKAGGTGRGVFTVAGTVYKDSGTPQIQATVEIYPNGSSTAQATMATDGLGNFFTTQPVASLVPAAGQQFALGAHVVVRATGGGSRSMLGVITNGSCNSCHSSAGGVARVTAQQLDPQFGVSTAAAIGNGESLSAPPAAGSPLAQIAIGASHGCVVKDDGTVLCWGSNAQGQLGNAGADQASAMQVGALAHVRASTAANSLAVGDYHSCVISEGIALCWGSNANGQLGNGNTQPATVSIPQLTGVTALTAAGDSTCARVGSGNGALFYCWGTGTSFQSATPRLMNESGLPQHALPLLDADGSLVAGVTTPAVPGLEATRFLRVATAGDHGCGITEQGRVKCWEGSSASVDIPVL